LASWYEFFNLATILRIAVPLDGTFILLGIATNSSGLCVIYLDSSPPEFDLYKGKGPLITADCLTKVKSISSS
jgi:hypothetical protein